MFREKSPSSPSTSRYPETSDPVLVTERAYKALALTISSSKQRTQKRVSKENQLNQAESSDGNSAVKSVLCKRQREETEGDGDYTGTLMDPKRT